VSDLFTVSFEFWVGKALVVANAFFYYISEMGTIAKYLTQVKDARDGLIDESVSIVQKNQDKIVNLNKNQFTDGFGSDDQDLINIDPTFYGTYSLFTSKLYPNKPFGGLYDFFLTGAFIHGLFIKMGDDKLSFTIDSTGKGSGEKALFFSSYKNLFGLDSKNTAIVNYQYIYPEILTYLNSKI